MLDLHKYDYKKFNKDSLVNKRIKAVFLLFDKYVEESRLNYFQTQILINSWIRTFIQYEEYELAEAFKQRKMGMWRSWRKIHRLTSVRLFYRIWRMRISRFFKNR